MKVKYQSARRGVLLLVILGLLAMFGLVAVAFVVVTGHAQRTALTIQRIEQYADPSQQLLHQAAMQLFRGTNNWASAIGPHSLGEDIYGNGWDVGTISSVTPGVCGGELIEFTASIDLSRRIGCVITMLPDPNQASPAAGLSTRIVGVNPVSGAPQMLAFREGVVPLAENPFVVNGVPFSGTGFGFNPATGTVDAVSGMGPIALLPGAPENFNPAGGANEDYDAPDFQNMLLAMILADGQVPIPSLHRPALVNYWMNHPSGRWSDPNFRRMVILRPLVEDHPGFALVNPAFDPVNGPWDVDNDGDGVPDGIWVDLGMPVRSTPDGRLYKPLFSVLGVDQGGRLNLNAHGNSLQATTGSGYYQAASTDEIPVPPVQGGRFAFASANNASQPLLQAVLPRGQGYGPAEINLGALLSETQYQQLLLGNGTFDGRYGGTPGASGSLGPGVSELDDFLSRNMNYEYAGYYWSFWTGASAFDAFGSPPNPWGMGAVGLDPAGRPLYLSMGQPNTQNTDDPYEIDLSPGTAHGLSRPAPIDNPFSVAEQERILRPYDVDSTKLPARLADLTGGSLHLRRHEVTSESWDLPCPNVVLPPALAAGLPGKRAYHLVDLLRTKAGDNPAVWRQLLPPEMLAGLKMDLNRPFGNARDDNGDAVVDNRAEEAAEQLTLFTRPDTPVNVAFEHLNVDVSAAAGASARQLHARYLYVLMMLLTNEYVDQAWKKAHPGFLTDQEVRARVIAQWAVNVVDFRDRDSIMTRFPYDVNPFNGWNPDGTVKHTVWGCERPELLITETLAFHDRRTEDLDIDPTKKKTTKANGNGNGNGNGGDNGNGDGDEPDDDFDQRYRPEGSLFIELVNPWTELEPRTGELHTAPNGGVDLAKTVGGSPVWRLIIVDAEDADEDPDDPIPDPDNLLTIERAVYFVRSGVSLPGDCTLPFRPSDTYAGLIAPILPGRYAVIGPGDPSDSGTSTTYIGFKDGADPSKPSSSRHIELAPNTNPNTPQVRVVSSGGDVNDLPDVPPPVAVVINQPRRLSISEPEGGYPADSYGSAENPAADPPADMGLDPADPYNPLWNADNVKLKDNGTYPTVKIVHLQRLANPFEVHSVTNPYRTVDSMAIDLTSFNGVTSEQDNQPSSVVQEQDHDISFYTRERGEHNGPAGANNLWAQEPYGDAPKANKNPPSAAANHYFGDALHHTLGYLNDDFQPPSNVAGYLGDPQTPFPWLNWNNRPFVSQLELLLVPAVRSSRLLMYYGCPNSNPYRAIEGSYSHLMNFFYCRASTAEASPPLFYRLLEYVHVPSRFVGTTVQADPEACVGGEHSFQPPFNRIPRYREPGRINLNTISSRDVWLGLMNYFPDMNVTAPTYWRWERFLRSRQGYDGNFLGINSACPTRFARPFRSFGGASMVPPIPGLQPDREIDVTLLRPDPDDASRPLFSFESTRDGAFIGPHNDPARNPYFRYQGLQRLGNLVTTRSNVYAVWITVGYFQVQPWPGGVDSGHPDGYTLRQELGSQSGDVQRHRAFYIFDRSIPVGFQRGQDLNVEKAILLKRFIE